MRRSFPRSAAGRWLVMAVLSLPPALACGRSPASAPGTASRPSPGGAAAATRIVVLGDSIAAGMGLAEDEAFPAVVGRSLRAAGHDVEVVNAGVSGDTSAGGLARVDWVLQQRPAIVVVELGGNDALRGQPLEGSERNLREIVRRARAAGARVVLLGMDIPSNYGPEYSRAFTQMYERVAHEEGITLVPGFVREVGLDPSLLQPDALHPTAEGQRRLAARLAPVLATLLAEEKAKT